MKGGQGIEALETISEDEMDRRLEMQHDEVVAMLEEARAQRDQGKFAPLEPLAVFLKRARQRFAARK